MNFVGRSVTRLEDRPLVTGNGRFAADVSFAHQLHMRVVRSPYAHARIRSIDTAAARNVPGVVAIWTTADVADIPPIDFRLTRIEGLDPYRQPILATDRVRYVGEPVAVVFATDPYVAEDAADLVSIEVEPLPALMDADAPPGAFDAGHSTEAALVRKSFGDVDAAFARAHAIVALDLKIGRHSGVPLETRGAIARVARGILELYGAAKVPHWNRDALARMLGREPSSVHLHEGHVGGGFGVRGEIYPEDVLVCVAALRLGRPVKWIEDRREHLMAANQSRQQHFRVRAAVDADGRLLAIDGEFFHDQGAYVRTHAATVPDLAAAMLPGPYRMAAYRMVGRIRLTNKTPCGTYRAPGRYESTFVRERLMDAIAAQLKIDPIEIRRRNLIAKSEMPYVLGFDTLGTEMTYDSGDYAGLLDKALGGGRLGQAARRFATPPRRRRNGRRRIGHVRRKKRARAVRRRARDGRHQRRRRSRHRRGFGRPRRRNRRRADLRRCARRRLSPHPRRARPDRSHRLRHGRLRLARHGDDRRSHPHRRDETARQGACGRGRAVAIRAGNARHHRRQGGAQERTSPRRKVRRSTLGEIARALAPAAKLLGDALPGLVGRRLVRVRTT